MHTNAYKSIHILDVHIHYPHPYLSPVRSNWACPPSFKFANILVSSIIRAKCSTNQPFPGIPLSGASGGGPRCTWRIWVTPPSCGEVADHHCLRFWNHLRHCSSQLQKDVMGITGDYRLTGRYDIYSCEILATSKHYGVPLVVATNLKATGCRIIVGGMVPAWKYLGLPTSLVLPNAVLSPLNYSSRGYNMV